MGTTHCLRMPAPLSPGFRGNRARGPAAGAKAGLQQ
jgi:hypothetical protein